jgi:secretory lipase/prolyl oligopeptidase family protein
MIRPVRALRRALVLSAVGGFAAASLAPAASASPRNPLARPAGTVVSAAPLNRKLWIPGTTGQAYKLTYVTSNPDGRPGLSTGEVFIPKGDAPARGWPVISWAHGTSGLGDSCAPSVMGPAEPQRDFNYLRNWMKEGYAVVATDYYGLGTPGLPAYLNGRSEAHNVVDMVKAARAFAAAHLLANQQLSNRWVVIGQSQGGGAAIYTARYATQFGGPGLDYLGAVGTGVPAYIENYLDLLGPNTPPVALTPDINTFFTYMLASIRRWRPQLGIDKILTAYGRKYLALGKKLCIFTGMDAAMQNVVLGKYFTKPLTSLPNWTQTIDKYMKMPETGFDKPFFMGHGLYDTDVPYAQTARYVAQLEANHQPVTFKTYPTDHSGALVQAQKDEIPYVRALFNGTSLSPYSRLKLAFTARRPAALQRRAPPADTGPSPTSPVTTPPSEPERSIATPPVRSEDPVGRSIQIGPPYQRRFDSLAELCRHS